MKLRCAILDDYQKVALSMADWSSLTDHIDIIAYDQHFSDQEALVNAIKDCQIVVIMRERTPFNAALFARLPHLKCLITSGMRNAVIDLESAAKRGIVVCGTKSASEPPVELTWALILGLARHIVQENNAFRSNNTWQSTMGTDLCGKQLGLLGLGKIGIQVARIAKAFGMNVTAWSQNLSAEKTEAEGVTLASSKKALLENSDFVSIHLVLSERTQNLINTEDFEVMRRTAFLINTSRAAIVNQKAMIDALKNNKIAGVGIDVFETEPLPEDHILRTLPNVLATPHIGYVTKKNYSIYFQETVENIQAFLSNSPVRVITDLK